jgi:hemoglobin
MLVILPEIELFADRRPAVVDASTGKPRCLRVRTGHRRHPVRPPDQESRDFKGEDVGTQQMALYDRLGGIYPIATVVDDFIDRIMVDDRLNKNPRVDEAHHKVLPPGFKYLVTEMLAEAAGGPQRYTGRPMEDSHRELLITSDEWDAFMDDLNQTLDKFEVPQVEKSEVLAPLGG